MFLEQHAVSVTRALHVLKVYHGRTIKSCSVCDQPIWTLSKSYLRCYACGGKFHIACKAAASEAVCLQKRKFDLKSTIIVSEHFVKLADPSLPMGYILVTEAGVGLGVKREEDAVEIQAEIRWKDLTIEVDQGQGKSISMGGFIFVFDTAAERDSVASMLQSRKKGANFERQKTKAALKNSKK